jgi:hypothetical protein
MATISEDGLEARARFLCGDTPVSAFTYIALGEGTGAESTSDTALGTEITTSGLERAAATCSYETGYIAQWDNTFAASGSKTINEMGIFNDPSAGEMYLRHKFTAGISVVSGQNIRILVQDTQAQA